MSHYSITKTQMKSRTAIVVALQAKGFSETQIESSDTLLDLKTYSGSLSGKHANIRIKGAGWKNQNHLGTNGNDLGFELIQDGTYTMHIDKTGKYTKNWCNSLMDEYTRARLREEIQLQGYYITEEQETSKEIVLHVSTPY